MIPEKYQNQADETAYDEIIKDIQTELVNIRGGVTNIKKSTHNLHELLKVLSVCLNDEGLFDELQANSNYFTK